GRVADSGRVDREAMVERREAAAAVQDDDGTLAGRRPAPLRADRRAAAREVVADAAGARAEVRERARRGLGGRRSDREGACRQHEPTEHAPTVAGATLPPVEATRRSTFLSFQPPAITEAEIDAVAETLRSGWLTTGPRTAELEARMRDYLEAKHVLAVSSC